jgi:hypothetical protein
MPRSFSEFSFKVQFEFEEVSMEKVIHLFKPLKIIFYFKIFEPRKVLFESIKVKKNLDLI